MKTVDEQAVYTCIKNLLSSPTSYSKMILEDADWQEGGISWNDKAQVKELKEEIEIIFISR